MPLWDIRAMIRHLTEDHQAELAVARDGRERFPTYIPLIRAELRALAAMGRFGEMDSVVDVAFDLPPQTRSVGWLPVRASFELSRRGHDEAAAVFARRGLAWFEAHPETAALDRARVLYYAGRYDLAEPLLVDLVSADPGSVLALRTYGTTLVQLGRSGAADRVDVQMSELPGAAAARARAFIAAVRGDRDAAVAHLQTYFDLDGTFYTNGDAWLHNAPELASLRGYPPFETLIRPR